MISLPNAVETFGSPLHHLFLQSAYDQAYNMDGKEGCLNNTQPYTIAAVNQYARNLDNHTKDAVRGSRTILRWSNSLLAKTLPTRLDT